MTQRRIPHRIVLARHAETEWSESGRHTGRTDIPLTAAGRLAAVRIGQRLEGEDFARVLTSPLQRAFETCRLAGFAGEAESRDELLEWDYGDFEGLTAREIQSRQQGWDLWRDGAPGGERPADMAARIDRLITELLDGDAGDVLLFGHGHSLRAFAVRWVTLPIEAGRLFRLETGTVSTLGWKRETRVIDVWNDGGHLAGAV
jgi:probable phosphoglycerate mutase